MYSGTGDAFVKIWRTHGFWGLYRGFPVNSLGIIFSQMYVWTQFLVFTSS